MVARAPQRDRRHGGATLLGGEQAPAGSRTSQITSDAAHAVLVRNPHACTGTNVCVDEQALGQDGGADLGRCRVVAGGGRLESDLFLHPLGCSA